MKVLPDRQTHLLGTINRYLGPVMLLLLLLTLTASDAFAHGVSEDDKAFIVQSSGMRLLPFMGIVGAGLVAVWAYGLLRDTGRVLLDAEMNVPVVEEIREVIMASPISAHISDLHVWRVGKGKFACILSLVTKDDVDPEYFKRQLSIHEELIHVSVEVNRYSL